MLGAALRVDVLWTKGSVGERQVDAEEVTETRLLGAFVREGRQEIRVQGSERNGDRRGRSHERILRPGARLVLDVEAATLVGNVGLAARQLETAEDGELAPFGPYQGILAEQLEISEPVRVAMIVQLWRAAFQVSLSNPLTREVRQMGPQRQSVGEAIGQSQRGSQECIEAVDLLSHGRQLFELLIGERVEPDPLQPQAHRPPAPWQRGCRDGDHRPADGVAETRGGMIGETGLARKKHERRQQGRSSASETWIEPPRARGNARADLRDRQWTEVAAPSGS